MRKMKEKKCRHCGTTENLRMNKNGGIYNCCITCYQTIEIPEQMKKTKEALLKKYGVSDLGELRQKRLIENPPPKKPKKIITCKYCGTNKNLVKSKSSGKRTIEYNVCETHWKQYQIDKHEQRKKSNLEKFGAEHPMFVEELKNKQKKSISNRSVEVKKEIENKRKKTNIKKYGVENPIELESFKEKREKAFLVKYGVTNPMQIDEFKLKQRESLHKNYGVDNPLKSKEIKNKVLLTNLNKYGNVCPLQNEEIKTKAKNTLLKNWGVAFPIQNKIIKQKIKETNFKIYGSTCSLKNDKVKNKVSTTSRTNYWSTFLLLLSEKKLSPLFDMNFYINPINKIFSFKCQRCNNIFETEELTVQRISCGCLKSRSSYEDDIVDWLKSLNVLNIEPNKNFYENGKKLYEIDVFLKDYNIGIEFNGLYWHSELFIDSHYHQNKYLYFKNIGINLIQIFENDWKNKESIIKSILKNKLKLNKTIPARKCELKEISKKESMIFLMINHLQEDTVDKVRIGLYYDNSLIALGTFGKNRFTKYDSWELIRFCNRTNYSVIGGFQKIITFFEKKYNPKALVSYIDLRLFDGSGYIINNFITESITEPNYYYFHKNKTYVLFNRMNFQKHKLKNKLKKFDPLLSEYDNMINNGYLRIYDAGNLKMVKNY